MTSVNKKEIDKFSKWPMNGGIQINSSHFINYPIRIKYIKENIINNFKLNKFRPLSGINILDIGCGGGYI